MRNLAFATRADWAAFHEAFLSALPPALHRFNQRAYQASLPADGTIDSLGPIGDWYLEEIRHPGAAPDTPLPPWWQSEQPWAGTGTPEDLPLTRDQVILIDEVHGYVADVLFRSYPGAEWIVYKGERREVNRGKTLLALGDKKWPVNTVGMVLMAALRSLDDETQPANWLRFRAFTEMAR